MQEFIDNAKKVPKSGLHNAVIKNIFSIKKIIKKKVKKSREIYNVRRYFLQNCRINEKTTYLRFLFYFDIKSIYS
jgi:hypothetical protein